MLLFIVPFVFVCMAINVSKRTVYRWVSLRHDSVDPMLLPLGNPFKCHDPMIPPKRFDIFSPTGGCSEDLQYVWSSHITEYGSTG